MKTLIIDNYDSFTYNLYQMVSEINGEVPYVIQNNSHTMDAILALDYDNIIISPGPGHPDNANDFGICGRILLESSVPILGVCLGHQGLCSVFGGKVVKAFLPMHGRLSTIHHNYSELFDNIPNDFKAVRYHSLVCHDIIPSCLEVTARSNDGLIMGIRHRDRPLWGIQYHPESICTEYGRQLLINFKNITQKHCNIIHVKHNKNLLNNSSLINGSNFDLGSCNFLNKLLKIDHKTAVKPQVSIKKIAKWFEPKIVFDNLFSGKKDVAWLDSSLIAKGLSRFSMMGGLGGPLSYVVSYDVNTNIITKKNGNKSEKYSMDIFEFLQKELNKYQIPPHTYPFQFNCGFVGYFGYELYSKTMPLESKHISKQADAEFLFLDRMIVFDHEERSCYLLALSVEGNEDLVKPWFNEVELSFNSIESSKTESELSKSKSLLSYNLSINRETYLDNINNCLHYIYNGDSYEICLTNKLNFKGKVDPYSYYLALRNLNPAPYSAFLNFNDVAIACSSIERYLLLNKEKSVESRPIKGTLPRGISAEIDKDLIYKLQNDEKFRSENLMIVDLLRNDLSKVCEIGSVHVSGLMEVESYETVHQLVSTVRGVLKSNLSAIDCIMASFPGGSMTGAPKLRTMDIINQLETEARGIYSGSIGYLSLDGTADLNIVIRTAVITREDLTIGVGGAIIALSDAEDEYKELFLKSKSLQMALDVL